MVTKVTAQPTEPRGSSKISQEINEFIITLLRGRGGSSSGNTSDCESRGPGFDSRWELGFFSLRYPIRSLSLIRSLMEMQTLMTFLNKKCLAVQLEAKQAFFF